VEAPRNDPREEAKRLVSLLGAQPFQLLSYLSGQLAVIKTQAQMLMGLCGLTVTVTGFSGSHMVKAGPTSSALMIAGIALTLVAAILCLKTLTETRWVSQELDDALEVTTLVVITRRDRLQHRLSIAGRFIGLGLGAYLAAVATAAFANL
jgi:hypothetical protein